MLGKTFAPTAKWRDQEIKCQLEQRTRETYYGADIVIPSLTSDPATVASTSPEVNFPEKPSKFAPRDQQAVYSELSMDG